MVVWCLTRRCEGSLKRRSITSDHVCQPVSQSHASTQQAAAAVAAWYLFSSRSFPSSNPHSRYCRCAAHSAH
eukprot:5952074-Prymnesium_polylepis.1